MDDVVLYIYLFAGVGVFICMVLTVELIRINHPEVFKEMGSPGEHKIFDLRAYYSVPAFILKRKHKFMDDAKLSISSDLTLWLFVTTFVLSLILLFSSNTFN